LSARPDAALFLRQCAVVFFHNYCSVHLQNTHEALLFIILIFTSVFELRMTTLFFFLFVYFYFSFQK